MSPRLETLTRYVLGIAQKYKVSNLFSLPKALLYTIPGIDVPSHRRKVRCAQSIVVPAMSSHQHLTKSIRLWTGAVYHVRRKGLLFLASNCEAAGSDSRLC
jgi:hypothetical protein